MRDFHLDIKCSKCGFFTSHNVEYQVDVSEKEFLLRTCRRCGYQWKERCADDKRYEEE